MSNAVFSDCILYNDSTRTKLMDNNTAMQIWLAVLMQACADLMNDQYRATALNWFHSKRTDCGSFYWICTLLERDPDQMRTKLTVLKQHPRRGKLMEKYGVPRKRWSTKE